jgi:UDP-N-acetylglucosamine 2-epimerase (non-hydrolysing)
MPAMRVLTVFGTRPEAIKMAPLVRALSVDPRFEARLCVTAQHRDMLDQALRLFEVRPDDDLDLMRPGQSLHALTARMIEGLEPVLRAHRPDVVLVHGDTTTCLAATLAAFYSQIAVGHVEAGLRTGDLRAPFPEEANRVLCDRLATWHFAPTAGSAARLVAEGVGPERLVITGNTVIDALLWVRDQVRALPIDADGPVFGAAAPLFAQPERPVLLVTGPPARELRPGLPRASAGPCGASRATAPGTPSSTRAPQPERAGAGGRAAERPGPTSFCSRRCEYRPFVRLMDRAMLILTDSGGIQEEAPSLGKPVLVMRDVTERPEGVEAGTVRLVGTDPDRIVAGVSALLDDPAQAEAMRRAHNPYGDGRAAARILDALAGAAPSA